MKPQKGDTWEVRLPGKRKIVKRIYYIYPEYDRFGHQVKSGRKAYVQWYRLPKGRYSGIWVATLLKYGRRLSTAASEERERRKRWKRLGL